MREDPPFAHEGLPFSLRALLDPSLDGAGLAISPPPDALSLPWQWEMNGAVRQSLGDLTCSTTGGKRYGANRTVKIA